MAKNLRSPIYRNTQIPNTAYTVLDIYIWEGDKNTTTTPVYTLKKSSINGSDFVSYEVSELIRDYLNVSFNGDYSCQSVWYKSTARVYDSSDILLSTTTTTVVSAFDSYSYFEERSSFNISNKSLLISNREMFVLADDIFRIPIHTINNPTIIFLKDGNAVFSQTLASSLESEEQVKYISINGSNSNYDSYKSRVLADSNSTFEDSKCLQEFLDEFEIGEVDEIRVSDSIGTEKIKIITIEECKYEPKKVTFINKFGALQDMYFFKKAVEKMTVKKESYKANIKNQFDGYSASDHVNRDFNIVANESISLSSGFLSEEYNEVFKQLLLSEKVWITNITDTNVQVLPINVKTSNITYKTSLNDKLVDYKISFDKSFDTINNIR